MQRTKWHLCTGGHHQWPEHLKVFAFNCCRSRNHALGGACAPYVPDYLCSRGKHLWSQSKDALRCCDGYLPVWQPMGSPSTEVEVRQLVLAPISLVVDMDDLASRPDEKRHLYWPM